MKKEEIYEAMGEIEDNYINDAHLPAKKKSRPACLKWGALAACLCLMLLASIPFISSTDRQEEMVDALDIVVFNGAYYEIVDADNASVLKEYELPKKITSDMVGDFIGASLDDNGIETKRFMHQYIPYSDAEQKAVYVLKEGEKYSFALFCNYIYKNDSEHSEASEMFAIYGVNNAEDIATITMDGKTITDADEIQKFFDSLYSSYAMGNDEYQKNIYQNMEEEKQQALANELGDSSIEIKIITKAGVVINHIGYYPTINYVFWALNYYKLTDPI